MPGDEDRVEKLAKLERLRDAVEKSLAPAGSLGLPKLLDEKRLKYGITNGAFKVQPAFDRVLIKQLAFDDSDTYGGGLIVKTDHTKKRETNETPRGIIISAGLEAMDFLHGHGMAVGHTVRFIKQLAWMMPVDTINNVDMFVTPLIVGDIVASEDLAEALSKGECRIEPREIEMDDGVKRVEHVYVDKDGQLWQQTTPFMPGDQ